MQLPETMRTVALTGHGGLDKLEYHEDWPTPTPAAGEVLVRVAACGLNNTDINTHTARYSKSVTEGITDTGLSGCLPQPYPGLESSRTTTVSVIR